MSRSYKIMAIEAKDLWSAMHQVEYPDSDYNIRAADGSLSLRKFSNTYDWSLDAIKLAEVYEKRFRRKDFAFKSGRHLYTKQVICVTFKYALKEFNMAGKNTYVRCGYNYRDCNFVDGVDVRGGRLIAIQTNVAVKSPMPASVLEGYFTYIEASERDGAKSDGCYKLTGQIPTIMDKAALRRYLYTNGFGCDGTRYVRYKRSSGSSRVGKCLFVNEVLASDMNKWDCCGLTVNEGDKIDLAAWEAYISLPMSSIIDTMEIPLDSILVIDDCESKFEDEVVAVGIENGHLAAEQKTVEISNSIWDGQSLMDKSLFGKYEGKGMLLLRNRFFKSCCFNTNIQQWFADRGITSVDQLKGYTQARNISQIKLITTPSSIKYAKFGKIEDWLDNVDPTFGIVKYEKKTHKFDGRMVQSHYQLFNTLQLSYEEMEQVLKPSLDFIAAIRRDPAVLRYAIKYPYDENEEWTSLDSKNEIIFKMLGINDRFAHTKMYYDFRDDLIKGELRNLRRGHVLISGNYSTLMGNGLEMLKAAIGEFDGTSELAPGEIHSTRFGYGERLLCSRSPHVTVGNILIATNAANRNIDRYFNMSTEIVYINSVGDNIMQRLNGADLDSDTMLITDDKMLIGVAEKNYSRFKVPTNMTTSVKTPRHYTNDDKADLDVKTSVNLIGAIINLSQQLNSLMWDKISRGSSLESCQTLYEDICKLAVLSNVEIDRAKKEFVINSATEIDILKRKYKITDDERTVKPWFFKMITMENGFKLCDNIKYRYFNTSMDHLQRILGKFKFREGRAFKRTVIPFMDIVTEPKKETTTKFYYEQRDRIISAIRNAQSERRRIYTGYDLMRPDEKEAARAQAWTVKQDCIEEIASMRMSPRSMYLVLKSIDSRDYSDIARFVFEILFGRPDEMFFQMIKDSREDVKTLVESPDGDIEFYGFRFKKVLLSDTKTSENDTKTA